MLYVIDAGVAVKWFIPEEDSAIAHRLLTRYLQGLDTAIAPDLLISECGNVFWRRCRQGDITPEEAAESLDDLLMLNIPLVPASSLVQSADDWRFNISVPFMIPCILLLPKNETVR